MFRFFENLVSPFPNETPEQPPRSVFAFCKYYAKGMTVILCIVSLLSALIAVLEVSLFAYLGQLVDWFAQRDRSTFLREESGSLITMSLLLLVVLPFLVVFQSFLTHQTLLGNFPMKIRWQAHRYLMGQSLGFFQNEFAGRIATKVMQTALSVRETVMKLLDILVYISVYFLSIVVLVFTTDWRLGVPLVIWLCVYVLTLRVLIPRLKRTSQIQADARSVMTGRLVDCYTNITTMKLFAHSQRESEYAKQGMDSFLSTVHPQMRLVTILYACVWISNALLVFSVTALSVYLWLQHAVSPGEIAVAVSLCLRLNGMSQWVMWEVSALFENIGTVQDGMNTLSNPRRL